MGRTFVSATITGPNATREYSFLVDTGARSQRREANGALDVR